MQDKLGICQWFHYEDYETLDRAVELMEELGVRHLRTGISWADYHRPNGRAWFQSMLNQLQDFEILLSVWHTPPSIAEGSACNGPPRRLLDFADFIWQIDREFGSYFNFLELWNEPNNRYKWDFTRFDPSWEKFGEMIAAAASQAKIDNITTVLGGMIPIDPHWLNLLKSHAALEEIDIVGVHGFPEMWWKDHPNWDWARHWKGWPDKINKIANCADERPVWITETGLATWNLHEEVEDRFDLQEEMLIKAAHAPVERVYWYSLIDLDPEREAIEGFHVDENEYHLGLVTYEGRKKPAFETFQNLIENSMASILDEAARKQ